MSLYLKIICNKRQFGPYGEVTGLGVASMVHKSTENSEKPHLTPVVKESQATYTSQITSLLVTNSTEDGESGKNELEPWYKDHTNVKLRFSHLREIFAFLVVEIFKSHQFNIAEFTTVECSPTFQ